jgi:hypothetical protein
MGLRSRCLIRQGQQCRMMSGIPEGFLLGLFPAKLGRSDRLGDECRVATL